MEGGGGDAAVRRRDLVRGRLPEADARPHPAERQGVARPHRREDELPGAGDRGNGGHTVSAIMGADFVAPSIDWFALSPILVLLGGGLVLLVVAALTPMWPRRLYAWTTVAIVGAALVLSCIQWDNISDAGPKFLVGDALSFDAFSMF